MALSLGSIRHRDIGRETPAVRIVKQFRLMLVPDNAVSNVYRISHADHSSIRWHEANARSYAELAAACHCNS
ncbi:hypothetical protein [Paracraurococcus ruber]|uniref:hypothetical protein n=1 Tax=Paracraurococcus ruber TaxID=77675 RepID=UPI00105814D7|nr:hypothetical protein [Paracraurococcus ruber]TDG27214.1 hypothetical protein E2C05_23665 [Paracraurococcus ruber]